MKHGHLVDTVIKLQTQDIISHIVSPSPFLSLQHNGSEYDVLLAEFPSVTKPCVQCITPSLTISAPPDLQCTPEPDAYHLTIYALLNRSLSTCLSRISFNRLTANGHHPSTWYPRRLLEIEDCAATTKPSTMFLSQIAIRSRIYKTLQLPSMAAPFSPSWTWCTHIIKCQ